MVVLWWLFYCDPSFEVCKTKRCDPIRLFFDLHQFVTKKLGTDRDTKDVETR
jgi:hypothetical protein